MDDVHALTVERDQLRKLVDGIERYAQTLVAGAALVGRDARVWVTLLDVIDQHRHGASDPRGLT